MSLQDSRKIGDVKIVMLKGEKGNQGDVSEAQMNAAIQEAVGAEVEARQQADAIINLTLQELVKKTTFCSYKMFGAVGNGIENDFDSIKTCHEYANENNLPIVNFGGSFYVNGTTIQVASNVLNIGSEYILGSNYQGTTPLFIMEHDTVENVENVQIKDIFSSMTTIASTASEYFDKCFIVNTNVNLGTSQYTGAINNFLREPIITNRNQTSLLMDDFDTIKDWYIDITDITDVTENGYIFDGGIVKADTILSQSSYKGVCFLNVKRNNCTIKNLIIQADNSVGKNAVIIGDTANNLLLENIDSFSDVINADSWGYDISIQNCANVVARDIRGAHAKGGMSNFTTVCIKNFKLSDSSLRTYDCHYNAFGKFIANNCQFAQTAHIGYGKGTFTIEHCIISQVIELRADFVPCFAGKIVIKDTTVLNGIEFAPPASDDGTKASPYFDTINSPAFILDNVKCSTTLFKSIIPTYFESLMTTIELIVKNSVLKNFSDMSGYGKYAISIINCDDTTRANLSPWRSAGNNSYVSCNVVSYNMRNLELTPSAAISSATYDFYEKNGTRFLHFTGLVSSDIASGTEFITIHADESPKSDIYTCAAIGNVAIIISLDTAGHLKFRTNATISSTTRIAFNLIY